MSTIRVNQPVKEKTAWNLNCSTLVSSSEVDRRIDVILASLATQLETLLQSVRELSEESLSQSTERNAASERSRSSGQRSDSGSVLKLN